jgi:heme-degrading monooxygenase HmoA
MLRNPSGQAQRRRARKGFTMSRPGVVLRPKWLMILRMWRARATAGNARQYAQYAVEKVFPRLGAIEGYRGAYLLRRVADGAIEIVVLTLWESMEAVRKFAGAGQSRSRSSSSMVATSRS